MNKPKALKQQNGSASAEVDPAEACSIESALTIRQKLAELSGPSWPDLGEIVVLNAGLAVLITIEIDKHRYWFDGHFPDLPILPGIVQVNWAAEICRRLYAGDLKFNGLQAIKFQKTISPATSVQLRIDYCVERQRGVFVYQNDDEQFSSGRVYFGGE